MQDFALRERVADLEVAGIVQAYYIAGVSIFHHFLGTRQEGIGIGEAEVFAGAHMAIRLVAFKLAAADPQERNAVAVPWVDVRMDLEHKSGEFLFDGFHHALFCWAVNGGRGQFQEGFQ